MTWVRTSLYGVGAAAVLLLLAAGLVASSSFQTWAVRRALGSQPGVRISIAAVSAGLTRVEVTGLRVEREGRTLHVPRLDAEVSLWAALVFGEFTVSRLQADGFAVEMSAPAAAAGATPATVDAAVRTFAGLLAPAVLPEGVALDGVDCAGVVTLPGVPGTTAVRVTGGGLRRGHTGRWAFSARSTLTDAEVAGVELKGDVAVAVAGDRRVTLVSAQVAATARGPRFPAGVALQGDFAVQGAAAGEAYTATVVAAGREVLNVAAEFNPAGQSIQGSWKIDLRDGDVAPFFAGRPLPGFAATGQGTFVTTLPLAAVRVAGKLRGAVDHLERGMPGLPGTGAWQVEGEFDLAEQNGVIGVQKCEVVVGTTGPVATLRSLQAFEFNPRTRELRAADPLRDLLGVVVHGVPPQWLNPWLGEFQLAGDGVRGELVALPRGGGVALRSVRPLATARLDVSRQGRPYLKGLGLETQLTADYSPQGWQMEFKGLTAREGERTVATLEAKVGGLAGPDQAVKTAGRASMNVPAWLAQPLAAASHRLAAGEAHIEFAASINRTTEVQAGITVKQLAVAGEDRPVPEISLQLRADVDAAGRMALDLPVVLKQAKGKSDLQLAGSLCPGPAGGRTLDLQCTGVNVDAADLAGLGTLWPLVATPPSGSESAAVWAGWGGQLRFQFGTFKVRDGLFLRNAGGRLRLDDTTMRLEDGVAVLADGAQATAVGEVTFEPRATKPYRLTSDVVLKEYDLASLWRGAAEGAPAVLDGRFEVIGRLAARSRNWLEMAGEIGWEFQLTSKGGIFRGLPVSVASPAETAKGLAGLFASAGSMLAGGLSAKKEQGEIVSRPEAVAELARGWSGIVYDQLSVRVTHDAAFNTILRDFTLITPELRLSGYGTALHKAGRGVFEDGLAMKFRLRARGRQADLLKYLGALESQSDDLGYLDCSFPLAVGGTLGRPDATELNRRLQELALEKPGLTSRAAELLNKLWGGAKVAP